MKGNIFGTRAFVGGLLAGSAMLAYSGTAQAQDSADEQFSGLQTIVVTAQKREQNVQDTPISVTALSGETLAAQGIEEVADLKAVDPSLQIGEATGVVTTFIRGIGNPVTTAGNEASVPVYIDDVYFTRAAFAYFDLASIERIEILKGPQGTLFGRNASGGVINVVTADPDLSSPALKASLGYGNYQTMDATFYGNMPIGDSVAANLSVSYNDQNQGWGRNKGLIDPLNPSLGYSDDDEDYWKGRSFSARGKLLFDISDAIDLKLVGYYVNFRSSIGIYSRPFPGTLGGTPNPALQGFADNPFIPTPPQALPELGFYDVPLGGGQTPTQEMFDDVEGYGFSGRLDIELGFADLVSITAYRESDELYYSAGNYSPYDYAQYSLNIVDEQFSQEFQLKSPSTSAINWILGLYYLDAKGGFAPTTIEGPAVEFSGIQMIDINGQQDVKSYAAFGQITYPVTDRLNITAGLRYTIDEVTGNGFTDITFLPGVIDPNAPFTFRDQIFNAGNNCTGLLTEFFTGGAVPAAGICDGSGNPDYDRKFKKLTWRGAIDYDIADDVLAYASVSRGYKAGTFNTLPLDSPALQPEVVDAYEVGLKSELLDRLLRLNIALFWNDIENPQIQAQRNGLVFLRNAGSARTKGVEVDITAAPAPGLTLRAAASYLDAKFTDFNDCPTYTVIPSEGALVTTGTDCTGNRMPYTSKWKFAGGIDYLADIVGTGEARFTLNASYSTKFPWDADNVIYEPSRFLLDGSVAFTPEDYEHVTFRFWMKNITGKKYNINYYAQAGGSAYSSAPGAPRTYGGEIIFEF
ncbi:TonB-dependent receptor [Novosphingobium marinum]|uniref:Iron complex outermembrane receptor protein n=1 Tax=Novosphingobium marinum TaxID=1514948 RepID=A0A7Z0BSZ5_9SPHN|nr:TonB-dependent receptor [Novosphingobium marinum]NYH95436.1 iron complex outermembrane receptor protein [Novosphingobium marinum]GGC27065.1 TonB-dependent receptor [Novosphingobium marinum]